MNREDIKVAVLRIEGTNCEEESHQVWKDLGAQAEKVHLKQFLGIDVNKDEERDLEDYQILMIPGGFSAGDYIRAGAIFGARMKSAMEEQIEKFVGDGKPVLGVCNGFQVLVEMGLLPALQKSMTDVPTAVLATNDSNKFECRPTLLQVEENEKCCFTQNFLGDETVMFPSAHAEGKLVFESDETLEKVKENEQIVFRYTNPDGSEPEYPWNPNGSIENIAGICNPKGNVLGLMPHPERAFHKHTHPDWTRKGDEGLEYYGDGKPLFESALKYVEREF